MTLAAPLLPADFERHRRELTAHCYRMLGSGSEAEDAVQETMVRAWRHAGDFEGRASLRSWLYRIATNVCIDMSRQVQRRARPMDLGPPSPPDDSLLGPPLPERRWITPIADVRVAPDGDDPADAALHRESIRLAFVAALQYLPPRQRAALLLCDVLRYPAAEAAAVLETTVPGVNSALQRARATLRSLDVPGGSPPLGPADTELLERYVDAFERYDIEAFVGLLHEDAVQSMPPFAMWVRGAADIGHFMVQPGPSACRGSRLVAISANGCPAFAQYKPDPGGGFAPWGVHVLDVAAGKVEAINTFLAIPGPEPLFGSFGLPLHLDR